MRDDSHLLPLRPSTRLLVVHPQSVKAKMETAFRPCFEDVQFLSVGLKPTKAEIEGAQETASQAEVTVIAALNARQYPEQTALIQSVAQQDRPLVLVALRSPYDLSVFPEKATQIAIYGEALPSLEAMARLLCGAIEPSGLLPVDIPGLYGFGDGLTTPGRISLRWGESAPRLAIVGQGSG